MIELICKNCNEQISKKDLNFANKKGYFPDDCEHEDYCSCRSDDDDCICQFEED